MKLLIVDDEESLRFALEQLLLREGYEVITASSGEEAISILEQESINIVLLDYHLPGINGIDLLALIKENYSWVQVILITAFGSESLAIQAIKKGAYDYITKPFDNEILLNRINHIKESLLYKNSIYNNEEDGYYFSEAMKNIIEKVKTIAKTDIPVLICGESGTGKELIARICHKYSNRKGNFISVNCSSLPQSLIESELFGAEKGSYTGSINKKIGFFELANNGTIFLDEIGEMPFDMQAKLLRVLQEGEIIRIGGGFPIKINSRVIAATNRNIPEEIKNNRFREDLFYRLNVFEIKIPPLRYRKEEIKPLSIMFLKYFNQKYKKNILGFDKQTEETMIKYNWKGNIRELKNKIEQAVILTDSQWITEKDLQLSTYSNELYLDDIKENIKLKNNQDFTNNININDNKPVFINQNNLSFNFEKFSKNLTEAKKELFLIFEREFILYYLNKNKWNVKNTAEEIGLCKQDLYKKIKLLGIQKEIKYI